MSQRPYQTYSDDQEEEGKGEEENEVDIQYLSRIADLIFKHLKNTITAEERLELDQWRGLSDQNRELFDAIPQTDNMEILFAWVFNRYWQKRNGSGWN